MYYKLQYLNRYNQKGIKKIKLFFTTMLAQKSSLTFSCPSPFPSFCIYVIREYIKRGGI